MEAQRAKAAAEVAEGVNEQASMIDHSEDAENADASSVVSFGEDETYETFDYCLTCDVNGPVLQDIAIEKEREKQEKIRRRQRAFGAFSMRTPKTLDAKDKSGKKLGPIRTMTEPDVSEGDDDIG